MLVYGDERSATYVEVLRATTKRVSDERFTSWIYNYVSIMSNNVAFALIFGVPLLYNKLYIFRRYSLIGANK